MNRQQVVRGSRSLFVAMAVVVTCAALPATANAQQHDHNAPAPASKAAAAPTGDTAKLDALIATMNSAKGEARFAAMEAVITELAAQRTALTQQVQDLSARDQSSSGGPMNMGMDHMVGMMKDMQAMMGSCTMMQGAHPPAAK